MDMTKEGRTLEYSTGKGYAYVYKYMLSPHFLPHFVSSFSLHIEPFSDYSLFYFI